MALKDQSNPGGGRKVSQSCDLIPGRNHRIAQISIAKDGAQALSAMKASPCHLVISDLNMPNLDGIGLLKGLREHAPTSKVGFILVTGKSDKATIDRARQFGLNNYLAKPFTVAALKATIEAVVGKL